MNVILDIGIVLYGFGKEVLTTSIDRIIQDLIYCTTPVKLDDYVNVDDECDWLNNEIRGT